MRLSEAKRGDYVKLKRKFASYHVTWRALIKHNITFDTHNYKVKGAIVHTSDDPNNPYETYFGTGNIQKNLTEDGMTNITKINKSEFINAFLGLIV